MKMLPQIISWMLIHSLWIGLLCWAMVRILNSLTHRAIYRKHVLIGSLMIFIVALITMIPAPIRVSEMPTVIFYTSDLSVQPGDWWTMAIDWINANSNIISLVWLLGMCLAVLRLGQSHRQMKRYQSGAIISNDAQLLDRFTQLQQRLGIRRTVILKLSSIINSPMCTGFFKPVIYLPIGLSNGLLEDELDTILQHELAHIRHHDFIINYGLALLETIFFFNPMVILLAKELRQEMEYACDDLVTQNESPLTYSRALVKLQELKLESTLALAANHKNSELKKRINRMINSNNNNRSPRLALITMLLALCLISTAFTSKEAEPETSLRETVNLEMPVQEAQSDTLRFDDMEALQAKIKELGFENATKHIFMLKGMKVHLVVDANNSLKKGEEMMKEIQNELISDGLLNPERPKMTLMFQYSDLLNGKANLGSHYEKYKAIFNRYFPKYDSYATTRVFRYKAD